MSPFPLQVRSLGAVPYGTALGMQEELVRRRREGAIPDQLLFLEHPHVITVGRTRGADRHVLLDARDREERGIELFEAGRGGDVTYHGPGQWVGYPILALEEPRRDLHRYLRDLEEVLIRAVGELGICGERRPGFTGVWVGEEKLAAIGVRLSSGWITSHGFALNAEPDLSYFTSIVPCGIPDREVTSLRRLLGEGGPLPDPATLITPHFLTVFGREWASPPETSPFEG